MLWTIDPVWSLPVLKKVVAFRFDPELLQRLKASAETENRTLTNFVETTLKSVLPKRTARQR